MVQDSFLMIAEHKVNEMLQLKGKIPNGAWIQIP